MARTAWETEDIVKLVYAHGVHDSWEDKWSYGCHLPLRIVNIFYHGRGPAQDYMACLLHAVNRRKRPPR